LGFGYGYDSAWRLQSVTSPAGTFGYGYTVGQASSPASLVRTIALPNSGWITNHYDSLSRLDYTALVNYWGHVLDGYAYGYDYLGLRTSMTRDLGLTNSSVTVGYDAIGQLTLWQAREGTNGVMRLNEQLSLVYDKAGNLLYRTNGGLIQTFSTDQVNQLTNVARNSTMTVSGATPAPASSVTVNGQAAQTYGDFTFARTNVTLSNGNNTFTVVAHSATGTNATNNLTVNLPTPVTLLFDANGNLTNDGTRSFAYDAENRVVTNWVAGAWKTVFVYDGLGRRRIEWDYGWQSGNWTKTNEVRFVYDGWLPIQERDANNNVLVTYTRGLDLSASLPGAGGIGGLLARTDGNGSTCYHADGAGNVTALMDEQQNMAARYMYGPFGRLTGKWGPLADANVMQFSSMPRHANSGLSLYPFRGYDPSLQRWLNRDPVGEAGGINLYGFVGNNPIDNIDPYGLTWLIFDPQAYTQLFKDIFIGDTKAPPIDPNSLQALNANGGLATTPLYDANGNLHSPGDLVLDVGVAVVKGPIVAATTLPLGGEEGAYAAANEALQAARAARNAGKCVPKVTNPKLKNLVNDLYKGAKSKAPIGTGSTADAIRSELATGLPTGGTFHSQKGEEYITALTRWLNNNPNASSYDRITAQSLINDLQSALSGK
jgi:RHS repeat-associated protein